MTTQTRPVGPPMKYGFILAALDDMEAYTPGTITTFAVDRGFIARDDKLARTRLRIAMGRLSNNHQFPDEGDRLVYVKGQSPTPGWFGDRWKTVLEHDPRFQ